MSRFILVHRFRFDVEKLLEQLAGIMKDAYENRADIREKVAEIVTDLSPAGEHGSEKKGEVYERTAGGRECVKRQYRSRTYVN